KHQIQIAVADLPAEQLGVGRKETGKFAADVLHRFLFRQRMVCGRHGTPPFLLNRLSPWSISTKKDLSLLAGRTPGCKKAAPAGGNPSGEAVIQRNQGSGDAPAESQNPRSRQEKQSADQHGLGMGSGRLGQFSAALSALVVRNLSGFAFLFGGIAVIRFGLVNRLVLIVRFVLILITRLVSARLLIVTAILGRFGGLIAAGLVRAIHLDRSGPQ